MNNIRILLFLITTVFVLGIGYLFSLVARGYRLDPTNLKVKSIGLLVLTSEPNGAEILINGKLESATNATISLPPDTYDVEIRKDAYVSWKKRLTIKKEEVTKYDSVLFPVTPSLTGVTSTGVAKPILSPDGTKIAYAIPKETTDTKRLGIWVLELTDLPIGFSREPRQITDMNPTEASWSWSPDSRELLVSAPSGTFVLPTGSFTAQGKLVNVSGKQLEKTLNIWREEQTKKISSIVDKLPVDLRDLFTRNSSGISISPDTKRILYTATANAELKEGLINPIPGSSTQVETRKIEAGNTYVYDLIEDRNFIVYTGNGGVGHNVPVTTLGTKLSDQINLKPPRVYWFPTSNHIMIAEDSKITISDYDGLNAYTVWSGAYTAPYAIPMPSGANILILTSLGGGDPALTNLYTLGLK